MLTDREAAQSAEPPSEEAIQAWLVTNVARELRLDPSDIDIRQTFADYGLDSLQAVSLSGDLETWLHKALSPTVAWDYPTIEQLAGYLAQNSVNGDPT